MNYKKIEIKKGIILHEVETNKFKTDLFSVFLSIPLTRQDVTKNALIAAVLRRGSKKLKTQELISKELENMYGASFDCGVDKMGDTHTIKFYLEAINNEFLPTNEDLSKIAIETLLEIVFNPLVDNNAFNSEYVEGEKENLKQIIEGKIDNKGTYAVERCIEEMYKEKPYGLYKYGYIEDLKNINAENLYEYYTELIKKCKIDIFASGQLSKELINKIIENENIQKLEDRQPKEIQSDKKERIDEPKIINESMQINQGKLILGLDIMSEEENKSYIAMLYNTILGVGANSKLFQNVREKASLAYTCGSNYIKRKQIILIRAGIEIENYEKAIDIIKVQLEDMKNGKFSDEDIDNAKQLILSTIDNITEEQDTQITYYFGQELANESHTLEEYKDKIRNINKDQIINMANSIKINIIYFLKD